MIDTAKAILERGDPVLIFPEGTRIRPGALAKPKRGVGRLALETGATVVPVAMRGTEAIRKGILIRPHKIRVRIGAPLKFPKVETATGPLAAAVTDRIWPNVMLQWEWLGGLPPLRRAAIIGSSDAGVALAAGLAQAGIEVELTAELSARDAPRAAGQGPPRRARRARALAPRPRRLRHARDRAARGGRRARPATSPAARACSCSRAGSCPRSARCRARSWPTASRRGRAACSSAARTSSCSPPATTPSRARSPTRCAPRRLKPTRTKDVIGAELAACAEDAAALAVATAGPDEAGKVLEELGAYARRAGFKLAAEAPAPRAGLRRRLDRAARHPDAGRGRRRARAARPGQDEGRVAR